MSREAMKQSLITEAAIQSKDHPSKDARTFAKSVHEYLMAEQPAQQCKWPTCQSEEYQQALAEQIKRELFGEQPAPTNCRHCGGANNVICAGQCKEQPAQQEPVAWMWRCKPYCNWPEWSVSLKRPADSGRDGHKPTEGYEDMPLYTSPPAQRKPLTDAEIERIYDRYGGNMMNCTRAIERAHGIKENT